MLHQDISLRREAKAQYYKALRYFDNASWDQCERSYNIAADNLNYIYEKTPEDFNQLITIYYNLSCSYFNNNKFALALETNKKGIACYSNFKKLEDNHYRRQLEFYLNTCDTYLSLSQQEIEKANECLNQAIVIFNKIQNKNKAELELKNITNNPKMFYEYYEKQISTTNFINSNSYRKQSDDLDAYYHQKRLDDVFDNFNHIQINQKIKNRTPDPINEITTQLNRLSFFGNNEQPNQDEMEVEINNQQNPS